MEKLLKFLLNLIVDRPEKIKIEKRSEMDNSLIFTLNVPKDEIGRVIGKGGKTIKALTALTRIKAIKKDQRVVLEVKELS
ncbi:KH domain-containing protein [Candidatus Microgenomates bacterium]|nr:KH domain-containing protein [Candidatus Microgenomates bacterium]